MTILFDLLAVIAILILRMYMLCLQNVLMSRVSGWTVDGSSSSCTGARAQIMCSLMHERL